MRHGLVAGGAAPPLARAAVAAAAIAVSVGGAQAVPVITLKPANASLTAEFSRIDRVRELSDGRVLVADGKENRLDEGRRS